MKVSLKWLSEYVDVPSDTKAFCDRLDLTGTGVEAVERTGAALDGVVVGHVLTCELHPDSDHLHVVTVDVGAGEPVQIVCGAPNIAAGIKVPVATVGAVLPGDLKIKKSKLRGVPSCGMCCSQRELGMGGDHAGIWILPEDAPVGMPIADFAQLSDTVLDLEITPNRPDCLSMVGMAREVGAMYRTDYESPLGRMAGKLVLDASSAPVDETVRITIEDAVRCPRYTARVIRGVKVGPSPDWMVERLAGYRPALHQQHRGRDELYPVPVRPAAARLRPGQAQECGRRGAYRGARGRRRRAPDYARRRGSRAHARYDGHLHAGARCRGARGRHGRPGHRGHGRDGGHPAGGRHVRAGPHEPHEPQPGPVQREFHALRARRGRPRHRGAFGRGRRAHGGGGRGLGERRRPQRRGHRGRVAGALDGARFALPHPALLRHDGGWTSRAPTSRTSCAVSAARWPTIRRAMPTFWP